MRLSFVRSGGLAAIPALAVRAAVNFDEGIVTAEPAYRRRLDREEAIRLAAAVDRILEDASLKATTKPLARDAFVYQFSIERSTAERAEFTTTNHDARSGSEEVRELVAWAAHEAEEIVRRRLKP